ncbi:DUF6223 family protein [Streptomyces sp. NBC_01506]|uniref:DUF6223 family protein n=1 Tax=Streptomyces sp. NBC_01506 TaxID=2903887 RepID=UPI00387071B0
MSVRNLISAAAVALLGGLWLAAPAAAHVSVAAESDGSGRGMASTAAVVGLISVVFGGLAMARSGGRVGGRRGALVALPLGVIGLIVSVLALAQSSDGVGTGNGRGGAVVGVVLALIGMALGWLALSRSRRTA